MATSSSTFNDLISLPNRFWSVGPKLAMTLFDGGQRSAEVDRTEAVYDQTVAKYRQTVLDGFREVENYLVQLEGPGRRSGGARRGAGRRHVSRCA